MVQQKFIPIRAVDKNAERDRPRAVAQQGEQASQDDQECERRQCIPADSHKQIHSGPQHFFHHFLHRSRLLSSANCRFHIDILMVKHNGICPKTQ